MIAVGGMVVATDEGTLGGSALASWTPLTALIIVYVAAVVGLWLLGSAGRGDLTPFGALSRIGRGITRVTGLPGWAGVAVGQSLYALLVAGIGFYSDVSWHIALGRDDELLTAPHTAILLGLVGILGAAVLGTVVATVDRWDRGLHIAGLRVPWSLIPLGALGVGAVSGFPMDEIWHAEYGVDVTMWSPTHMLMILGASFVGLAAWLILADTGLRPDQSRQAFALHVAAAWLTLQGLVASQGEFSFGVPQYPQVFHPMLISMAAGLGLVAIRLVLGRKGLLWVAGIYAVTQFAQFGDSSGPVETRHGATFIASTLVVEAIASLIGVADRTRFALAAGLGIGTAGLAGEWWWNARAHQPWNDSLFAAAVGGSVLTAVGCALAGAWFAGAFSFSAGGRKVTGLLAVFGVVLTLGNVVQRLDRTVGDVSADMTFESATSDEFEGEGVYVTLSLTPADAADDAHWFQASAWQGGGLVLTDMVEESPGVWRSAEPVPANGFWKTIVRLHRNTSEMMAVPVWFPSDPEIDEEEIAPVDRTVDFESETDFLLRETYEGDAWLSPVVHGYLAAVIGMWLVAFAYGIRRIGGEQVSAEVPEPSIPSPQPV